VLSEAVQVHFQGQFRYLEGDYIDSSCEFTREIHMVNPSRHSIIKLAVQLHLRGKFMY
jgi:hypothetical protein